MKPEYRHTPIRTHTYTHDMKIDYLERRNEGKGDERGEQETVMVIEYNQSR